VVERLRKVVQNEKLYSELTQKLMVQGMLKLMERHVFVELKKEHIKLATSLFAESEKKFSEIMFKETGKEMESKLSISNYNL
jgi:V-type H+-transporting ATPase subunit E